jgi:hypothetical protein
MIFNSIIYSSFSVCSGSSIFNHVCTGMDKFFYFMCEIDNLAGIILSSGYKYCKNDTI